jgi:hypothetical protein
MSNKEKELELRGVLVTRAPYKDGQPSMSYVAKDGSVRTFVAASYDSALNYLYKDVVG